MPRQNSQSPEHKERRAKLCAFLRGLRFEEFHIGEWVSQAETQIDGIGGRNRCGTCCCAVGWMPKVFPEAFSWHTLSYGHLLPGPIDNVTDSADEIARGAMSFLGIQEKGVFFPHWYECREDDVTGAMVADAIEALDQP
jgi:hypothetical protein